MKKYKDEDLNDIEVLEEQIKLHQSSIKYLNEEIDRLLYAKLEKLIREIPEHKLYGFSKDYFCLESEKLVYVDLYGNHIMVRDIASLTRTRISWVLYKRICDVKLDNK